MPSHKPQKSESIPTILKRCVRTGHEVGFFRDMLVARWLSMPAVAPVLIREGLNLRTVHHLHAHLHPERKAVVDQRRSLDFRAANDEINGLANAMAQRFGVGPGTPVALAMKNRVEYFCCWMAVTRLGASAVHTSWRQTAEELAYQLDNSGAQLLMADRFVRQAIDGLDAHISTDDVQVVGVDDEVGQVSYQSLLEGGDKRFPRGHGGTESDNIVFTSGTTGRPKAAVREVAGFGLVELFRILDRMPMRTTDRHLVVCPLYHSGAQAFSMIQSAMGVSQFLMAEFDPENTLRALHEKAINSVFLVPTMLRQILSLPEAVRERYPTPALRGIFCGAAPFPHSLRVEAAEVFGASVIHDFYGATEIGWITLIDGDEMLARPTSVGRPLPGQKIRIVGDDGQELEAHEVGTIYVQNNHVMSGYLDNQEATDELIADGWMTVEDLGYVDDDGYLYLSGRARDMIISGGVNIYPAEIEALLDAHDGVEEVAVVGVSDERFGEKVVAAVVRCGDDVDGEELDAYLREHLSSVKIPRQWRFVESLPRNPTGKVLKSQLREQFDTH